MNSTTFFIPGDAKPAGSKRAMPIYRKGGIFTGKTIVIDACAKSKDWKATVAWAAKEHWKQPPLECAVELTLTFVRPRIKAHFRSNGDLKPDAPRYVVVRPDVLKLTRAVEDALTKIVWLDDSQIVLEHLAKIYGDVPGVHVTVTPIPNP